MRLAFFASGSGSSMRAIVAACRTGELAAQPVLLIVNRPCKAAEFAAEIGLPHQIIPTVGQAGEIADETALAALRKAGADWVVLSGYLRKLGPKVLKAYSGRILNIHPALLPDFGGEGMYGRRVHEAVVEAQVVESGATVHFVDGEYDHGEILAQARVPVLPADTAADLEARVMALEPGLFVQVLKSLAERPTG
jgi:phosphoribosylglycinamide formyltransferase-1